jgi:hypothetical protein
MLYRHTLGYPSYWLISKLPNKRFHKLIKVLPIYFTIVLKGIPFSIYFWLAKIKKSWGDMFKRICYDLEFKRTSKYYVVCSIEARLSCLISKLQS